jgi:hypothetical protein
MFVDDNCVLWEKEEAVDVVVEKRMLLKMLLLMMLLKRRMRSRKRREREFDCFLLSPISSHRDISAVRSLVIRPLCLSSSSKDCWRGREAVS